MGGVDLSDNLMVHFATARNRLKKYYKKVFRHLLDMAVFNAFITYKGLGGKFVRREYILRLVEKLIMQYGSSSSSGGEGRAARLTTKPTHLLGRHFPDYCPPTKNKHCSTTVPDLRDK